MKTLARLWKEEEGQDLIEYVLLIALIALAGLVGFPGVSGTIASVFTNTGTCLKSANGGTAAGC